MKRRKKQEGGRKLSPHCNIPALGLWEMGGGEMVSVSSLLWECPCPN